MVSRAEADIEARLRKHTENISRSLEKICDIIDENDKPETDWVPIRDFLHLIPMRYRAGGHVLELTAMTSWDHESMNKFELPEISRAFSNALQRAENVPWAMSEAVYGKEAKDRSSVHGFDDDTLNSIKDNLVSSFKVPHIDKAASDCISILLRGEIQKIVNKKSLRAKENIGICGWPEDGRLTRSRSRQSTSTRSDSPDTITPTSSLEDRGNAGDWEAYCDGCSAGCNLCLQDEEKFATSKVHSHDGWDCNDPDCQYRKPKKSEKSRKVYADSRSSPNFQWGAKKSTRVARKDARRPRGWSATSSEFGSPIMRSMRTMSLDDDSDLVNTTEVPEPKIYTATTASSASGHYTEHKPSLHIVNLVVEDIWDAIDHRQRREGHVTWSNGSSQAMWMDELSKNYSRELIEYYENSLKSKAQQPNPQYQLRQQSAPSYNSAQVPKSPIHYQWPRQYSSNMVSNPGVYPSFTGHDSGPINTNAPIHPYSKSFGMNGNIVGHTNPGGNTYNASPSMPNHPPTGAQPGGTHGQIQYNSASSAPRHTSFGAW
ncbi:hypothetical protein EG327_003823 [Venturia inaequalis]|uniref:Uncharacterized protein n=1 Tax=Venturia inaequalis TaxID=5025 RepID=A0A8H3VFD9_VENIN|nr:hypothetical protein EG327_003823 [Venturia inaequalis]